MITKSRLIFKINLQIWVVLVKTAMFKEAFNKQSRFKHEPLPLNPTSTQTPLF